MREERLLKLSRLVREHRTVDVTALQQELGVSYPTLRRDLILLSSRGVLQRVRGGAMAAEGLAATPDWLYRDDVNRPLKVRIGEAAARLVKPRQSIMIEDGGGTTLEVARALLRTAGITVVTNSPEIAYLMKAHGKCRAVNLTGGTLLSDRYLAGPIATSNLRQFTVDIAFIGAIALTVDRGITDNELEAAEIKRSMIQSARHAVLVADHTKIGQVATVVVCPLTAVHTMVTTKEADDPSIAPIASQGVHIISC